MTFSLSALPQIVRSKVLLHMSSLERVSYSLCSSKCKKQIVNLGLRAFVDLSFSRNLVIRMSFEDKSSVMVTPLGFWPNAQQVSYSGKSWQSRNASWINSGMSEEKWIDHCMDICHVASIITASFCDVRNNVKTSLIRRVLKGRDIDVLTIRGTAWTFPIRKLISLAIPARRYIFQADSFAVKRPLQEALFSNSHILRMEGTGIHTVDLDDLLATNASHLSLERSQLTSTHINRFLKLWMRGSNMRLRSLKIEGRVANIDPEDTIGEIPNQLITQRVLMEKWRASRYPLDNFRPFPNAGLNIRGREGVRATVGFVLMRHTGVASFHLFVWD